MSRINKLTALILCAFSLFTCLGEETLISPDRIISNTANYKTAQVQTGVYAKYGQDSVSSLYPVQYTIKYEGPAAKYEQYYVKRGNVVKKGDLLASFTVSPDTVGLYEAELKLARAKDEQAETLRAYDETLEQLSARAAAETDPYAREDARLRMRIKQLERDRYLLSSNRSVAGLQESYDELAADSVTQYIYAPADGTISSTVHMRDSEEISSGTEIMYMYDQSILLFTCEDSSGSLRFGSEVTVTYGPNNDRKDIKGRVVACGSVMPGVSSGTAAVIEADFGGEAPSSPNRPTVAYTKLYVGNTAVVDTSVISMDGGKCYVYKLSPDGMVSKRIVIYKTGTNTLPGWILEGAEPGETLIID